MLKILFFSFTSLIFIKTSVAQSPTLGLLHYEEGVMNTYTLFPPEKDTSVYLIDNCGQLINQWTFKEFPKYTSYLLNNGSVLKAGTEHLEIKDWDNQLVWYYSIDSSLNLNQHHDVEVLPNGNILSIVYDYYTTNEMHAFGKDSNFILPEFKLDKIVEIKPIGLDSAEIVWEWKFIDHYIQDFDSTKPNFGVVSEHPELLDINLNINENYTHVNAIDYNAELDQIIISARNLSEIFIIDHSTTTAEAASSSGGNFNKGGDFLWRWGNVQNYQQGTAADRKLFAQHDCKWIEKGYEDEGKITVFNNLGDNGLTEYSSIHIIEPIINNNNAYNIQNNKFTPLDYFWSWKGEILGDTVLQNKKAGCHALPNGNMVITETSKGRVSEINRDGDLLWSYVVPVGDSIYNQGTTTFNFGNIIFRGEKYPSNFIGFNGKDMTPKGIIENQNSLSDSCEIIEEPTAINTIHLTELAIVNPVQNKTITFGKALENNEIAIFNLQGKLMLNYVNFSGSLLKTNLNNGIYFIKISSQNKIVTKKILVL